MFDKGQKQSSTLSCDSSYLLMWFILGLLWTAPELLGLYTIPRNGTKEGDVYSFGIILHEIFYRMGTFAGKEHMITKGIAGYVCITENCPCNIQRICSSKN